MKVIDKLVKIGKYDCQNCKNIKGSGLYSECKAGNHIVLTLVSPYRDSYNKHNPLVCKEYEEK